MVSSINATKHRSNQLDQSFMYSQILKEVLLDIGHDNKAKKEFVKFCRELYDEQTKEATMINDFEQYYPCPPPTDEIEQNPSPIWWYTCDSFIYRMLNKALRTQDTEIIIKMGFFMRDIHRQIEELHVSSAMRDSFVVYRGQSMIDAEFEKIKNGEGNLLSFNSFLSTSTNRDVACNFTDYGQNTAGITGVLFRMLIDPSSCFACLGEDISFFKDKEKEVLFSMHTVFRVGAVKQLRDNRWEVELKSTKNDDDELNSLSDQMRKEIGVGTGWDRLGSLLAKMGEYEKAESIYTTLCSLTRDDDWRMLAHLNNQRGYIMKQKGDLPTAAVFYQKALEIQQAFLPPTHLDLATTYGNIGSVHDSMGDNKTALSFYQMALEIKLKFLPCDDPSLATTFNNIGSVHDSMEDYSTALSFYKKALHIQQKSLPLNHPSLATTFNNIGKIHRLMEDYPTALSFYQKACDIFQRALPPNHPSLATVYNNIGLLHDSMEDYQTALSFYQKTLEIKEKSLPPNHPSFATTFNNIAFVHKSLRNYASALSLFQKALDVAQRTSSSNHQDIQELKEQIVLMKKKL